MAGTIRFTPGTTSANCECPLGTKATTASGVVKDLSGQKWPHCCTPELKAVLAQQKAGGAPAAAVSGGSNTAMYLVGGVVLIGVGYWIYRAMK